MICRLVERASLEGAQRVWIEGDASSFELRDDAPALELGKLVNLVRGWEASPRGTPLDWCTRLVAASPRGVLVYAGKLVRGREQPPEQGNLFRLVGLGGSGGLRERLLRLLPGRYPELGLSLDGQSIAAEGHGTASQAAEPCFAAAQRLGSKSFRVGRRSCRATLYLVKPEQAAQTAPGFYLDHHRGGWLGLFPDDPGAALARVVVQGPVDPADPEVRGWLARLGGLARRRSAERLAELPADSTQRSQQSRDLVECLFRSARFQGRQKLLRGSRPSSATLRHVLECLASAGGQLPLSRLATELSIPEDRVMEILRQAEPLLVRDRVVALSMSLDASIIVLDTARLAWLYDLRPDQMESDRGLRVQTSSGQELTFSVPIKLEPGERRAMESLGRHGKMNERELAATVGTRRVGGLMETLMSRLEKAGWTALVEEGEGPEGRVYALRRELIA